MHHAHGVRETAFDLSAWPEIAAIASRFRAAPNLAAQIQQPDSGDSSLAALKSCSFGLAVPGKDLRVPIMSALPPISARARSTADDQISEK
jgi:hypothetical protein